MNETKHFLETLYVGGLPEGQRLLVWTNPGKHSDWFTALDGVPELAQKRTDKNVYIGCCLSPTNYGPSQRCPASEVTAFPGFWGDFDYASPDHKKAGLPPDEKAVWDLINRLPAAPTLVVHSGNGLQAWWLLKDPEIIESDEQRKKIAALSQAWADLIRDTARSMGYDADSVGDLARVMRLPGTLNVKDPANPKPVKIVRDDGPRWPSLTDFVDATGLKPSQTQLRASSTQIEAISVNPAADPDATRMTLLFEVEPKARDAWLGMACPWLKDQSDSARDMSISCSAALANWTAQEITDLLIAGRRHRKADLKHPGYYTLTVTKAKAWAEQSDMLRKAQEIFGLNGHEPEMGETVEISREQMLKSISEKLQIRPWLERVIKANTDPATYKFAWRGRTYEVGRAKDIQDLRRFRATVQGAIGAVVPPMKEVDWLPIVASIESVAELQDVGSEGSLIGQLKTWIPDYLQEKNELRQEETWKGRCHAYLPFALEGFTYISTQRTHGLLSWIQGVQKQPVTVKELAAALTAIGWKPMGKTIESDDDGKVFSRKLWARSTGAEGE